MYVGINMILTLSLNLVNGYMGEFSVGHAGFMGIGAYVASVLTVAVLPRAWAALAFPAVLICGGAAAAVAGLIVAYPSFRTRGDYLAIVTLAFNMIVKSVLENIPALGGPRGYLGMPRLTTLFWVAAWVILTLWILRNLIYSNFGRGITAIREDEVAANLTSVDTRRLKLYAFLISAFFAGVAGGLVRPRAPVHRPPELFHPEIHRHAGHGLPGRGGQPDGVAVGGRDLHGAHGTAPAPGPLALGGGAAHAGPAHDLPAPGAHGL